MENGKKLLAIVGLMTPTLFGCPQTSKMALLETNSNYSSYGYYNQVNDRLVYFGVYVDKSEKIIGSSISVKNFGNGEELLIEENVGYPALGWADSLNILIYKTLAGQDSSIFSTNYERTLYTYNISTHKKNYITDIPLKATGDNMCVDNNIIIYQTGFRENLRLFKYNLLTRETCELKLLRGLEIGDSNFTYDAVNDLLAFVVREDDSFKIKYLTNGLIKTIETSSKYIDQLCFDISSNQLFYIVRHGKDENQILKSFSFVNGRTKVHYEFTNAEECLSLSVYKNNRLILSIAATSLKSLSQHTLNNTNYAINLDINASRNLHIFKY